MDISYTLCENITVMCTSLVASIILCQRTSGISEDELTQKISWLLTEIQVREG